MAIFAVLATLPSSGFGQTTGADNINNAPAITAPLPVLITVDTSTATVSGETFPTDFAYSEVVEATVWFKWTAPSSSLYRIAVTGQNFDALLGIFSSTAGAPPLVDILAQNDDFGDAAGTFLVADSTVFINATSGTTYYIMVGGRTDFIPSGTGELEIKAASAPSNNNISAATNLGVQFPVQSTTVESGGATAEVGEPAHDENTAARHSLWWRWTADQDGEVSVLVQGTNPDNFLVLGIYTGGPSLAGLIEVDTINAGYTGRDAFYTHFQAVDGQTYYIAIDSIDSVPSNIAFDRLAIAITAPLVEVIAATGDALPGNVDQVLSTLSNPALGENGSVAFLATLKAKPSAGITTATDQVLLYRPDASSLGIIAREGSTVHSNTSLTVASLANPNPLQLQTNNVVQYEVVGKGTGISSANSKFVVQYDADTGLRAATAQLGTTLASGVKTKTMGPALLGGSAASTVFSSTLSGAAPTADSSIVTGLSFATGQGGTLLREGQAINGFPGVAFAQFPASLRCSRGSFGQPAFLAMLKSSGQPAAVNTSNDTALFIGDLPIAIENEPAPMVIGASLDGSIRFSAFGTPVVNASGEVAFIGTLRGGTGPRKIVTATDRGVFTTLGTGAQDPVVTAVARKGYAATNEFGQLLPAVFDSFIEPVLITSHHVIFSAKLRGTEVDASNDIGIWIWSPTAGLRKAWREGDLDSATGAEVGSILTFAASSTTANAAFLADPNRLDDLFILGTLVKSGPVTAANNLCLWHIGLNNSGDILPSETILRKSDGISSATWPRPRTVSSIANFAKSGGEDGLPTPSSRLNNVGVQITVQDPVTKASSVANIVLRASPFLNVP